MSRLRDLVKNVSNMTPDQLVAHVQEIRHNKYVAKPAVAKRAADVVKKEKNTAIRQTNSLLDDMTPEQKAELLKLLEGDNENG